MLIDWFTVGAQAFNFLVLVALLKYLLYDRIVRAMDQREQDIGSRFEQAEERERQAKAEKEKWELERAELDQQGIAMLTQVQQEGEELRQRLEAQARQEVQGQTRAWKEGLARQKDEFAREITQGVLAGALQVARHALADLADAEIQEQWVAIFTQQLHTMDEQQRHGFRKAMQGEDGKLVIHSAAKLSTGQKRKITRALHQEFGQEIEVDYLRKPELVLGLELSAPGYQLTWALPRYLDLLEHTWERLWRERLRVDAESEAKSSYGHG